MYYKKFKEWVDENFPTNEVVVYGSGNLAKAVTAMFDEIGCNVLFYLDDNVSGENFYTLDTAASFSAKIVIAIHFDTEEKIFNLSERCKNYGHESIYLDSEMRHLIGQTYGVPDVKYSHYIKDSLPFFEPSCFKEFLLRDYPKDVLIKTNKLLSKGYPYDLNAKFQTFTKMENLYFYNDVVIEENDIVVDGGVSYSWEQQISNFAKHTKNKVYGFEPNIHSYNKIVSEVQNQKNITVFNKGLSNNNETKYFVENDGGSMIVEEPTDVKIETVKLDDVLEHVDFIKMDIEGYELNALKGAQKLIKKCKPKLAICLYHKPEDIYEIPKFIKEIEPNYKMWVVNNEGFRWSGIKMFAIYEGQ